MRGRSGVARRPARTSQALAALVRPEKAGRSRRQRGDREATTFENGLSLEYQARLRQRDRFKKRLNLVFAGTPGACCRPSPTSFSPRSGAFLSVPITNRRVKGRPGVRERAGLDLEVRPRRRQLRRSGQRGLGPRWREAARTKESGAYPWTCPATCGPRPSSPWRPTRSRLSLPNPASTRKGGPRA